MELTGPQPNQTKEDPHAVGQPLGVQEYQAVLMERAATQSWMERLVTILTLPLHCPHPATASPDVFPLPHLLHLLLHVHPLHLSTASHPSVSPPPPLHCIPSIPQLHPLHLSVSPPPLYPSTASSAVSTPLHPSTSQLHILHPSTASPPPLH